ncbi:MAG: TRAP transporter large permease subunit [Paracoccus sp. (in: a-proteobacteria)]|nr:TRAP transporter large permease subunit [Paracoccus sp. (in: a-proteobacteria)]
MIELIAHNLAPIMFMSMVLFLLLGYPIAFALAANGLLFYVIGVELTPFSNGQINLHWNLLFALPERLWGIMKNDLFLAIPFFTFMGIILEKSGMAEDLLDTIGQLFGPVRGGLAYAVVLVGALLAATTGVVAASVIAMGLISLPIMLRYGYDSRISSGAIAASGTLAQIMPPSLVLIVLADQLGRSVGDMYRGALVPALLLTAVYMAYIAVTSILRPNSMPALPPEARRLGSGYGSVIALVVAGVALFFAGQYWLNGQGNSHPGVWAAVIAVVVLFILASVDRLLGLNVLSPLARAVIMVLVPPLGLVFLVLGTIFLGIATPTEGGAMGALGALLLAAAKGRLRYTITRDALVATTRLSAFVMFILIGATVFSLTFYAINGQVWVKDLLMALPGGQYGFLIVVSLLIFILGFFLDFFEIAFVIVPLLVPAANELGIDMIWFGVLLGMVLQTSFLTPPVGFALFYLRSVAPRRPYTDVVTGKRIPAVTTTEIYRGAAMFIVLQIIMIIVVIAFPDIVRRDTVRKIDTSEMRIELPMGGGGFGSLGGGLGSPFGAPPPAAGDAAPGGLGGGLGSGLGGPPNFGAPPASDPASDPATVPAPAAPAGGAMNPLGGPPPGLVAPAN